MHIENTCTNILENKTLSVQREGVAIVGYEYTSGLPVGRN